MKILSCVLQNFASYKHLQFDFNEQGLCLIQGPTGAGKSTLCDAIPWVLFGTTAKDGAVDEVRSWSAEGPTKGTIEVHTAQGAYLITRTRQPNDLYFKTGVTSYEPQRGKDLNDTQRLINNLLGIDAQTYLAGAYFHEFSQTAQFFTTTAKNRRALCEQLVDLTLAKDLGVKSSEKKTSLTKQYAALEQKAQVYADRVNIYSKDQGWIQKSKTFESDKKDKIAKSQHNIRMLQDKLYLITATHEDLADLTLLLRSTQLEKCKKCGSSIKHNELDLIKSSIEETKESLSAKSKIEENLRFFQNQLADIKTAENMYAELEEGRLANLTKAYNDHTAITAEITTLGSQLQDVILLTDVINDYRGISIKNAINQLESSTNKLLTDHYDAEIKVQFEVADADKLDVTILKDGNKCSYTQLSKGQRQLLKLSFGVSVMRMISNRHGTSFNCLFFDELTDGLDENMKVKTFGLLQQLALDHSSVFLVEHSEGLKSMFENKFTVSLTNGNSTIEKN